MIGIGALAASVVFASVWKAAGAPAAFALGAMLSLISAALLSRLDLRPAAGR